MEREDCPIGAARHFKCAPSLCRLSNRTAKVAIAPMLSAHHSSLRAFVPHAELEGATSAPVATELSKMRVRAWRPTMFGSRVFVQFMETVDGSDRPFAHWLLCSRGVKKETKKEPEEGYDTDR